MIGKNRIMIYGPKEDGTYVVVQDKRGRRVGDLNPEGRDRCDEAFPGEDAARAVRAG